MLSRIRDVNPNIQSIMEDTTRVIESLADETALKDAHHSLDNEDEDPMMAPDNINSYWSVARQNEQFALIREVVDAMPKPDMIRHLYEVFTTRCQGPLFNVVHTPTFLEQAEELCSCLSCGNDHEQQITILYDRISMDTLACQLLAVRVPQQVRSNHCSRCCSYSCLSRWPSIRPRRYMAGRLRIFLLRP